MISLKDYISNMEEDLEEQTNIYFIFGECKMAIENAPFLES